MVRPLDGDAAPAAGRMPPPPRALARGKSVVNMSAALLQDKDDQLGFWHCLGHAIAKRLAPGQVAMLDEGFEAAIKDVMRASRDALTFNTGAAHGSTPQAFRMNRVFGFLNQLSESLKSAHGEVLSCVNYIPVGANQSLQGSLFAIPQEILARADYDQKLSMPGVDALELFSNHGAFRAGASGTRFLVRSNDGKNYWDPVTQKFYPARYYGNAGVVSVSVTLPSSGGDSSPSSSQVWKSMGIALCFSITNETVAAVVKNSDGNAPQVMSPSLEADMLDDDVGVLQPTTPHSGVNLYGGGGDAAAVCAGQEGAGANTDDDEASDSDGHNNNGTGEVGAVGAGAADIVVEVEIDDDRQRQVSYRRRYDPVSPLAIVIFSGLDILNAATGNYPRAWLDEQGLDGRYFAPGIYTGLAFGVALFKLVQNLVMRRQGYRAGRRAVVLPMWEQGQRPNALIAMRVPQANPSAATRVWSAASLVLCLVVTFGSAFLDEDQLGFMIAALSMRFFASLIDWEVLHGLEERDQRVQLEELPAGHQHDYGAA